MERGVVVRWVEGKWGSHRMPRGSWEEGDVPVPGCSGLYEFLTRTGMLYFMAGIILHFHRHRQRRQISDDVMISKDGLLIDG